MPAADWRQTAGSSKLSRKLTTSELFESRNSVRVRSMITGFETFETPTPNSLLPDRRFRRSGSRGSVLPSQFFRPKVLEHRVPQVTFSANPAASPTLFTSDWSSLRHGSRPDFS